MAIQKVKLRLEKEDCTGPRKLDEKQIRHEQKKLNLDAKLHYGKLDVIVLLRCVKFVY